MVKKIVVVMPAYNAEKNIRTDIQGNSFRYCR